MRLTRPSHLLAVALVAGAATWIASSLLDPDGTALRLTWWIPAALLVVAGAVVATGWPVRRLTRAVRREDEQGSAPRGPRGGLDPVPAPAGAARLSDRYRVDPRRATQALALARASAFAGAALAGGYAAIALLTVPTAVVEPRVERLAVAGVAVLASVVLAVAGVVVERWCRLPGGRGGSAGS